MSERRNATATACVRVEDAKLGHRSTELRPGGVGRDEKLASDRLVRVAVGQKPKDVPLAGGQAELPSGDAARMTTVGERRIDVHPAASDGLKSTDERLEGCILEDKATSPGIERLIEKGGVSEA